MSESAHVVHVDPDAERRERLGAELVASDGVTVTGVPAADPALERLAEGDVACLVCADDPPEADAVELLERVRERDPTVPFVVCPGGGSETRAGETIDAGATGYVARETAAGPDAAAVLAERVRGAIADDRERREWRRAGERLAEFFHSIPQPAVEYAYDGTQPTIQAANEAFVETFGYDREQLNEASVDDLLVPPDKREEAVALSERVASGNRVDAEVERLTTAGRRQFLFQNIPLADTAGETEGYALYIDITAQKDREAALQRQNQRLNEFASVVSHDLRNPMEVIKNRVELARETGDHEHLEHALEALDRMDELVGDLLDLAKQGESLDETGAVSLPDVAEAAWEHVATGDATLEIETDATVEADRGRLTQLLENLFINAVEHGAADAPESTDDTGTDDAEVTVRVGRHADQGFFVADDGPGIPPEKRDQVFETGYTTEEHGTGFGLTIVRQVARAHDWEVGAAASDDGGARFEFRAVEFHDE